MRFVVLVFVFLISCGGFFMFAEDTNYELSGRFSLSVMFVFSGVLHLKYREGIYLSYPTFLSQTNRIKLLFAIGDLQFAFAASLLFADIANIIAPFILLYLLLGIVTQINICAYKISIKRGNYTGNGLGYLLFKLPEQLFIIGWTYYFVLAC